jgi:hypothetical protein
MFINNNIVFATNYYLITHPFIKTATAICLANIR